MCFPTLFYVERKAVNTESTETASVYWEQTFAPLWNQFGIHPLLSSTGFVLPSCILFPSTSSTSLLFSLLRLPNCMWPHCFYSDILQPFNLTKLKYSPTRMKAVESCFEIICQIEITLKSERQVTFDHDEYNILTLTRPMQCLCINIKSDINVFPL